MVGRVLSEWKDKQCSTLVDNALSVNSPGLLCYVHNNLHASCWHMCLVARNVVWLLFSGDNLWRGLWILFGRVRCLFQTALFENLCRKNCETCL